MRKFTLYLLTGLVCTAGFSQQRNFWTSANESMIGTDPFKAAKSQRPNAYKLYQLNENAFKAAMLQAPSEKTVSASASSFIVTFPMPDGSLQQFRVVDAPVMHPALAAKYPGINSYAGRGVDDPLASIRFDVSMHGLHAVIHTVGKPTVYIDQLYQDYYRVVRRSDVTDIPGKFTCLTDAIPHPSTLISGRTDDADDGNLRTYRLAMMSGAEFSNHFIPAPLPTLADSIAAVLAAQNSHVTRTNEVYERDFGVRLVLVPNNDLIIYFNPATDPIANPNAPSNATCHAAITAAIGSSNFDIGHTESKGSDNGNAGCIGCVCLDATKARGWTVYSNPSLLEFFVIDYLTHEMGHQFGGNHTFSFSLEGTGVNIEPGSGVTIMGYAGIVPGQNVAPHSIEIFSVKSIEQITNYIKFGAGSFCPVITATGNTAPTVDAGSNYFIPVSTPFKLTGIATDPDPGDALRYNWEQIDNRTGAFPSIPSSSATNGPMFRTYLDYAIPERTFPELQYILTGANGFTWEVLPSVGRDLNFRFIAKDNHIGGGNNKTDDMVVTTVGGIGPFLVTAPNTAVSWPGNSTQTVTWSVNGSTGSPVNCANVSILISTNGGVSFTTLIASTPNDGTENITVPDSPTSQARIKVAAVGNIFFDISNTNFTITPGGFTFSSPAPVVSSCPAPSTLSTSISVTYNGTFSNPVTLSATAFPPGTNVTFGTNPLTTGSTTSTVNLNNANILAPGSYTVTVTGTASGAAPQNRDIIFTINPGPGPAITSHPSGQTICVGDNTSFTVASPSATSIQWQVSTDGGSNWTNVVNGGVYSGATTGTLSLTNVPVTFNGYRYRANASVFCGTSTSNVAILTLNSAAAITAHPQDITLCAGSNHTFSVTATGTGLTYQWSESTDGGTIYNNLSNGGIYSGVTSANLTLTGITAGMNNYKYKVTVSGTGACPAPVTSNAATLTVVTSVTVTSQPSSQATCVGSNASFTVAGSGTGVIYQWQVSTDGGGSWNNVTNGGVYSGATTATLTITGATLAMNGYQYRAQLSNSTCTTPGVSNPATLTVNTLPAIASQPANSTICLGGTTSFTSTGTGTGIGYQWQVSTNGGGSWTDVVNGGVYSGATTSTLTITGATAAMNTYRYRVVVSGTCPPPANSNAAILTVVNPVSITTQPATQAVLCSGSNTSFTVAGASTETITYQWQVSTDAGGSWNNVTNGGVYSGANTATLTITGATVAMNSYRYRVLLSNVSCTTPTISAESLLIVRLLPTVGLTASQTSLLPGQTSTLTATPSAPAVGATQTITWLYNGVPSVPPITGNTYVANVEQVGAYQVLIQAAYTGPTLVCSNQSPVVTLTTTASSRLFIFPSPNDGRFIVSYFNNGGASTQRNIVIFDSKGSQVYNRKFAITGEYTLINIDLRQAGRGIYYVAVGDANGQKLADGKVHIR